MRLEPAVAGALLTIAILAIGTAPASGGGDNHAGVTPTDTGATAEVRIGGAYGPGIPRWSGGSTGGSAYVAPPMICLDFAVAKGGLEGLVPTYGRGARIEDLSTLQAGDKVWVECRDPSTHALLQQTIITWNPADPNAIAAPIAAQLGQQALRELVAPVPLVRTWPPSDQMLVALETWLHVENWAPEERTASIGAISSTVRSVPVRAVWHLGESDLTCASAGTVLAEGRQETDCGYTFHQFTGTSRDATVDLVYHLTWTSTLGDAGDLGEVTRTTTFPLRVWEAQAVIE